MSVFYGFVVVLSGGISCKDLMHKHFVTENGIGLVLSQYGVSEYSLISRGCQDVMLNTTFATYYYYY